MSIDAQVAVELAKTLENFVQQQSLLIQKLVGVVPEKPAESSGIVEVHGKIVKAGEQFDPILDAQISAKEGDFGEECSEEELARRFGETVAPKAPTGKSLKEMTLDEIKAWESAQDNASDLYKIKARMSNLARDGGASLTGQGEILVNTCVHMFKSLYDFADTVSDQDTRIKLRNVIRANENLPALVISAARAAVRNKKK